MNAIVKYFIDYVIPCVTKMKVMEKMAFMECRRIYENVQHLQRNARNA